MVELTNFVTAAKTIVLQVSGGFIALSQFDFIHDTLTHIENMKGQMFVTGSGFYRLRLHQLLVCTTFTTWLNLKQMFGTGTIFVVAGGDSFG